MEQVGGLSIGTEVTRMTVSLKLECETKTGPAFRQPCNYIYMVSVLIAEP